MKKLGFFIYILAFICSCLLSYGYRDFSLQLTAMFLFSVIGLSLGSYLITSSTEVSEKIKEIEDDCEVVGKFSIGA
tara:strand:+ start:7502 stop:7729 length:228 start_codon:yes stop_codon:yes gene_type:complete